MCQCSHLHINGMCVSTLNFYALRSDTLSFLKALSRKFNLVATSCMPRDELRQIVDCLDNRINDDEERIQMSSCFSRTCANDFYRYFSEIDEHLLDFKAIECDPDLTLYVSANSLRLIAAKSCGLSAVPVPSFSSGSEEDEGLLGILEGYINQHDHKMTILSLSKKPELSSPNSSS